MSTKQHSSILVCREQRIGLIRSTVGQHTGNAMNQRVDPSEAVYEVFLNTTRMWLLIRCLSMTACINGMNSLNLAR